MNRFAAFAVHVLTASGAALALFALAAAAHQQWAQMFGWLGAALIVDGIDGPLARRLKVATELPRWSGEALDFVVDFTTYVFVPAFALYQSELTPPGLSVALASLVAITGALYFADREMKTSDNGFKGFPAVWNLVAFYLLLLRPAPMGTAAIIVTLAVATFLPIAFVHPLRVVRWRKFNIAMIVAWAALAAVALLADLAPPFAVTAALCAIAVYFLLAGIVQSFLGPGPGTGPI